MALALAGLALAPTAHADWLAVYPTCAMGEAPRRSGPAELLYPRAGLPAFAAPGEALTMRIRVPAPLTPPPGVQQERALAGWYVELVGSDTIGVEGARHHYRLRVADVRPDGHSTLVYRPTVRLPPWIAPGTYDLKLRAPGTEEVDGEAVLRVGEGPVRLARLASMPTEREAEALARLPIDVWLLDPDSDSDSDSEPDAALPWLDLSGTFAVRVGDELLARGGCDDPHVPFSVAVRRAGGSPIEPLPTPQPGQYRSADGEHPIPAQALEAIGPGRWANRAGVPLLVRVVFPEGDRGLSLEGAERRLGFWPGTPVRPEGHRPSVVGLWSVAANGVVTPTRLASDPPTLEVSVHGEPTTHRPTPVRVRSSGRVALAWEEDGAAFVEEAGDRRVPVRFRWLEHHELHALAIGPRGATRRTASATVVTTERPDGCAAGGSSIPPYGAMFLLTLLAGRLRRRRFLCLRRPTR